VAVNQSHLVTNHITLALFTRREDKSLTTVDCFLPLFPGWDLHYLYTAVIQNNASELERDRLYRFNHTLGLSNHFFFLFETMSMPSPHPLKYGGGEGS